MIAAGPWQVVVLNETTNRWEVVKETGTIDEARGWIGENINGEVLEGKTKGIRRKNVSVH